MVLSDEAKKNQLEYIKKFSKESYKKFTVYVSYFKEKAIMDHLEEKESVSCYIKELILKDMYRMGE